MGTSGQRARELVLRHPRPPLAVPDFAAAAASAFADLVGRTGLDRWWVVRRRGDEAVVIASWGRSPASGRSAPWATSAAAAVVDGRAPEAVARVADVPVHALACEVSTVEAASLVVVPLPGRSGEVLGALCGASGEERPDVGAQLGTVRVVAGLLGALLDQEIQLDDEVRRAERAEAAADTDALTGLGNRRAWDSALTAEEQRAARHGSAAAVAVLDLDGLKKLNDTAGHDAGDDVLRQVADLLRQHVRERDVVARLGGDEFGLLLPDTARTDAVVVVARVRAALAAAGVAVSCGIGSRRHGVDLVGAWRSADEAMYADKRARTDRSTASPLLAAGAWSGGAVASAAPATSSPPRTTERRGAPHRRDGVDALLRIARVQLGADVAFVSTFDGASRRFRNVVADVPVPFSAGTTEPRDGTYCDLVVRGDLPRVLPDTSVSVLAGSLPVTAALGVGSHVGVPLHRRDGSLYGTLCAYSQRADLQLGDRDAATLSALGAAVMSLVEEEDGTEAGARRTLDRIDALEASGGLVTLVHPVVRLADRVRVGSDTETRFPVGTPSAREWFAQARQAGAGEALELAALDDAVASLRRAPGWLVVRATAATATAPGLARRLHAADPGRFVLQVVGGAEPEVLGNLGSALAPLRAEGLRLAVSGAGTRAAGAEHLLALEPDLVGIHPRLVEGITRRRHQQAVVNALVAFTRTTGAGLVARGVGSAEDLEWLSRAGVDLATGPALGA